MDWIELIHMHHGQQYGFARHYMFLYSIVLGMNAKNCFEFGCGMSTTVIMKALQKTRGVLTSCDAREYKQCGITQYDTIEWGDKWRFMQGRSEDIPHSTNKIGPLDFVLHDGAHKGKIVSRDLKLVLPRMRENSIILIHDTAHAYKDLLPAVVGVLRGIEHQRVDIPYGCGLTVIRLTGKKQAGKVKIPEFQKLKDRSDIPIHKDMQHGVDWLILNRLEVLKTTEPATIVDVGAFDGIRAMSINQAMQAKCRIHVLEPCARNWQHINQLFKKHDNLTAHKLAITGECGQSELYYARESKYDKLGMSSQSASLIQCFARKPDNRDTVGESVETCTLDRFVENNDIERIDCLTMNCVGSEYKIFDPESPLNFLNKTHILDISLHGKIEEFMTPEMTERKLWICQMLRDRGFFLVWGRSSQADFEDGSLGHIRQVWFRE